VEKALALDEKDIGKLKVRDLNKYSCFYLGSEFCQNIFPSERSVERLAGMGARKIAICVSFLVDAKLKEIKEKISFMLEKNPNVEIILGDFGLLTYLNKFYPNSKKSIARPLSIEFMRMEKSKLEKFLVKHRISAIETDEDDLLGNFPKPRKFSLNFHYPYRFKALQRDCFYLGKTTLNCSRKCLGKKTPLQIPGTRHIIYALNNAYFTKKNSFPTGADRIIYHRI